MRVVRQHDRGAFRPREQIGLHDGHGTLHQGHQPRQFQGLREHRPQVRIPHLVERRLAGLEGGVGEAGQEADGDHLARAVGHRGGGHATVGEAAPGRSRVGREPHPVADHRMRHGVSPERERRQRERLDRRQIDPLVVAVADLLLQGRRGRLGIDRSGERGHGGLVAFVPRGRARREEEHPPAAHPGVDGGRRPPVEADAREVEHAVAVEQARRDLLFAEEVGLDRMMPQRGIEQPRLHEHGRVVGVPVVVADAVENRDGVAPGGGGIEDRFGPFERAARAGDPLVHAPQVRPVVFGADPGGAERPVKQALRTLAEIGEGLEPQVAVVAGRHEPAQGDVSITDAAPQDR